MNPLTLPQQFLPGLKPTPKDITALLMTGSCEHCKKPVMPKNRLCQRCVERQTALASMKPFLRDHPDADVTDEVLEALATCDYDGESSVVDEWIKKKTAEIRKWSESDFYRMKRDMELDDPLTSLASAISGDVDEDDAAGDEDSAR